MPPEQEYFIGKELAESELGRKRERYPWLEIFESIRQGTAREVVMSYQTVTNARKDLEARKKIPKGEYDVITRRSDSGGDRKRRVFIVHHSKKTA